MSEYFAVNLSTIIIPIIVSLLLFFLFFLEAIRKRKLAEGLIIFCIFVYSSTSYLTSAFITQSAKTSINFLFSEHILISGLTTFSLLALRCRLAIAVAVMNVILWVVITLPICIPTIVRNGNTISPIITQIVAQFFQVIVIQLIGIAQLIVFERY
jgi:hypothetical protein